MAGQTWRGVVSGRVTDSEEQPVAGAVLDIVEQETNRRRTSRSDSQGEFTFGSLPPGRYRLEVAQEGFRKHRQPIDLLVNQEMRIEIPLLPGLTTEEVTVTARRELVKTDTAAASTVIDNFLIVNLPLDGRNFYELSLLTPGVLPPAQGSAGSARGDFAVSANGAREDSNYFLLDGIYNSDPKLNGVSVTPSVDAVREFEVLTSSYEAAFGRNAGAQVNVVLKSGTNRLHGSVYEFFRNAKLDARNAFAPGSEPPPQYQRNQFGFALGGPLRKDRTFWFGDYEGRRVREGITRITNVPTALERRGDFSQSLRPPADLFTQRPFPGNQIPAFRVHPVGRAVAELYPLPNRDVLGENFVSAPAVRDRADNFDLRLDHALADNSDLAVRYSFGDRLLYEPFSGAGFALVPNFGNDVPRRAQNLMVSETHTFTPALLNEVRLSYNRVAIGVFQQALQGNRNQDVGLPVISSKERDTGLSFISLPGFSPLGNEFNNPQQSAANSYQFIDQLTWIRGRHQVKTGFEFRHVRQNAFRDVQSRGFLNFFGLTGNPLGDLLQGFPTVTGVARLDNHQNLRTSSWAGFVQDTWRAAPSLVLTLGLRYEFNAPPFDAHDRANVYDSATGSLVPVGRDGIPRGGFRADRNNWAPRAGLAWSPGSGATVLRAGYGLYYDQGSLAPGEGLYFNAPYFDFRLFFPFGNTLVSLSDPFPANFPIPVPSSALTFQPDLRTPYMQHWSLSVQRALGSSRVAEVAYVGSTGTRLLSARDINQPRPSPQQPNLRPNPAFDDITALESRGNSVFHSLQARYQQRFWKGMAALASYSWSKSIDDASGFFPSAGDPNFPQDSFNVAAERSRSNFDARQRLALSYSYDLPLGTGWLLGGWQTSGVWTFQTGRPFTVALLSDLDNSNTGRSVIGFGANDRPNVIGDARAGAQSRSRWFNTDAFAMPPFGSFGNAGRNVLDGPGLAAVSAALIKNIEFRETARMQVRAEAFNLLNRTNLDLPDNFFGSPTFGRILSAQSPRHIQLGLKLLF